MNGAVTGRFPDWESFGPGSAPADRPAAFCGDLSPASLLAAYRRGLIPFPAGSEYLRDINEFRYEDQVPLIGDADPYWVAWWCPDPRPVIDVGRVHIGRNVRKLLRREDLWTTADHEFRRVAEECRAGREPRWLTDTLLESMAELHQQGWAHSIEVWRGSELAGGALGVGFGRVLSGDSMFSRRPDSARVAVADMAARLAQAGGQRIDAQWDSPFLRSLGAEPVPRERYLRLLDEPSGRLTFPRERVPALRLIDPKPVEPERGWR